MGPLRFVKGSIWDPCVFVKGSIWDPCFFFQSTTWEPKINALPDRLICSSPILAICTAYALKVSSSGWLAPPGHSENEEEESRGLPPCTLDSSESLMMALLPFFSDATSSWLAASPWLAASSWLRRPSWHEASSSGAGTPLRNNTSLCHWNTRRESGGGTSTNHLSLVAVHY